MEYHYKSRGYRLSLKLSRKKIAILAVGIAVLAFLSLFIAYYPWPITAVNYNNVALQFRVNLKETQNIPVYPNATAVKSLILNPNIKRLTFVVENTSDAYLSKLEAVDIALKLPYVLQIFDPNFFGNVINVSSFDNLQSVPDNPLIVLLPPSVSNGTYVSVSNSVIYISGKTPHDFDLATAKFILSSIGINI